MSLWNAMGTVTYTENGALTLKVSANPLVDFSILLGVREATLRKLKSCSGQPSTITELWLLKAYFTHEMSEKDKASAASLGISLKM